MDYSNPCCEYVGGIIEFKADGIDYSLTGDVTVRPSRYESEAMANNNGRMSVKRDPRIPDADVTFRSDCTFDLQALEGCAVDVVIRMPDAAVAHYFPRAAIVGTAEENLKEGEVSGLSVASPDYTNRRI